MFEAEAKLLRRHGHKVRQFRCANKEAIKAGLLRKTKFFMDAAWSNYGYQLVRRQIKDFRPDIVHVHNFFLILSPSIFQAAKDAGIPTVATLHNYRLLSPCSQFLRKGKLCEVCINRNPWRIMFYHCYRRSFWANYLRYRVYYISKKKHDWLNDVSAFIALTQFGKRKFIEGNVLPERIFVKPNFIEDPLNGQKPQYSGHGAVFVGRLSAEKGLKTLMKAWRMIEYPLAILGDGPMRKETEAYAYKNVSFYGTVSRKVVLEHMKNSKVLVFPSEWYEGFPCVLVESLAMGLPVVASNLGAMAEIIDNGRTGLLFEPGNPDDLRKKVQMLLEDRQLCKQIGFAARKTYLEKYTSEKNYNILLDIYHSVTGKIK